MPKIAGINHLNAIRALQKAGFVIIRQGKHTVLAKGTISIAVPRHNPINAYTMGRIVQAIGMTIDEFRKLL